MCVKIRTEGVCIFHRYSASKVELDGFRLQTNAKNYGGSHDFNLLGVPRLDHTRA